MFLKGNVGIVPSSVLISPLGVSSFLGGGFCLRSKKPNFYTLFLFTQANLHHQEIYLRPSLWNRPASHTSTYR